MIDEDGANVDWSDTTKKAEQLTQAEKRMKQAKERMKQAKERMKQAKERMKQKEKLMKCAENELKFTDSFKIVLVESNKNSIDINKIIMNLNTMLKSLK